MWLGCTQVSKKLVAEMTNVEQTEIAIMKLVWLVNDIFKFIDKMCKFLSEFSIHLVDLKLCNTCNIDQYLS